MKSISLFGNNQNALMIYLEDFELFVVHGVACLSNFHCDTACVFRYMQRFDPGFGFNGGPYTMQPPYSPAVNYNTEFPQLVSCQRPQLSIEHQSQTIPQHLRGSWSVASTPTVGYGPPESLMAPFNPNHVGAHPPPSIYMHSSQYPVPPCPGMTFVHHHEHIQPFAQVYAFTIV